MDLNKLRRTATSSAFLTALATVIGLMAVGTIFASSLVPTPPQGYEVCVDHAGNMRLLDDSLKGGVKNQCKSNEFLIEVASAGQFDDLQAAIDILNADQGDTLGLLAALSTKVDSNELVIGELETRIAVLEVLLTPTATVVATPTPTSTPTPTPTVTTTPTPTVEYQAVLDIIGITGVVLPLVADTGTNSFGSSFTTVGAQSLDFTWSEPVSAFDTPPGLEGGVPIVTFNGIDEAASSPDAGYWTRDDAGGANGFSIGGWVWVDTTTQGPFLNKDGISREWLVVFGGAGGAANDIIDAVYDNSAGVSANAISNRAISGGKWEFFVVTYDGTGGASAANGMTQYKDGASFASTAINNASYVGMEDLTPTVRLGTTGSIFFDGKIAGGRLGPFFTQSALSTADVAALYDLGKTALGLP